MKGAMKLTVYRMRDMRVPCLPQSPLNPSSVEVFPRCTLPQYSLPETLAV